MSLLPSQLLLPQRTVAQAGAAQRLAREAAGFGARGLLVHGRSLQRSGQLDAILAETSTGVTVRAW
jgi:hypothetical protein